MRRSLLFLAILLMVFSVAGSAQAEPSGYILEAEHSSGDWYTAPVKKTPYWDTQSLDLLPDWMVDRLYEKSYAMGAVVMEDGVGATSSIKFTPPEPGYYLVGVRMSTNEGESEGFGGQTHVIVLMRDSDGEVIPNELEVQALGYTWDVPVAAPVLGMWNLPAEPLTLVFRSQVSRTIFLDYFYLTPLFEAEGAPRVYLPAVPWPVEGDWTWGNQLDFMVAVSTMPGDTSAAPLYASVSGSHLLYVYVWHDGEYEQILDLQIGSGEEAVSFQVELPEGTYWKMAELGPINLTEGETTLRFTNNPANPPNAVIAIETIHVVPLGHTLESLPGSHTNQEFLRPDGLGSEWADIPVLVSDPEGDQSLDSDIKEVRALVANGTLNMMVDFYELYEHSGFVLDVDFDGNEEPEYTVEASSEGHWALINYPDTWTHVDISCSTFEVMEIGIPLELLEPYLWDEHPETICPQFQLDEVAGFYVRLRLTQNVEPYELDLIDWAYIDVSEWQEVDSNVTDGEAGDESGGTSDESPVEVEEPTGVDESTPETPQDVEPEENPDSTEADERPTDEPSKERETSEEEHPKGVVDLIEEAISNILNLLENLFDWIVP